MLNIPINFRRVAAFLGVFMLIVVVIEFNSRLEELNRLNDQRDEIRAIATQSIQTQMALQTQVAFAGSTNAVEQWARTEGHYVQDGDLPMVPIAQPGTTPLEMNAPTPAATPQANWQVWWDLFFGEH